MGKKFKIDICDNKGIVARSGYGSGIGNGYGYGSGIGSGYGYRKLLTEIVIINKNRRTTNETK